LYEEKEKSFSDSKDSCNNWGGFARNAPVEQGCKLSNDGALGSVMFFIGEFDPGSERTLAAGFIHASRAVRFPKGDPRAANG
jgi:hypothetical protein